MRRPERSIKERETMESILKRVAVGRMATVNREGVPVIKPVNFLYWNQKLYIHSSYQGEKIEHIHQGSPVGFELDEPIGYAPSTGPACMAGYFYRSIIIKGRATLLEDREQKETILNRMMEKYQPEGGYGAISKETLEKTALIEISIEEMTGKERLG